MNLYDKKILVETERGKQEMSIREFEEWSKTLPKGLSTIYNEYWQEHEDEFTPGMALQNFYDVIIWYEKEEGWDPSIYAKFIDGSSVQIFNPDEECFRGSVDDSDSPWNYVNFL